MIETRKSGSLERVLRVKRQQASTREEKATSSGEPRGPLKETFDFSHYDDDEIGLLDPNTLTSSSRDAFVEELEQRMAVAEAQAWQVEQVDDEEVADADYEALFEQAAWETEQT